MNGSYHRYYRTHHYLYCGWFKIPNDSKRNLKDVIILVLWNVCQYKSQKYRSNRLILTHFKTEYFCITIVNYTSILIFVMMLNSNEYENFKWFFTHFKTENCFIIVYKFLYWYLNDVKFNENELKEYYWLIIWIYKITLQIPFFAKITSCWFEHIAVAKGFI